QQRVVRRPRRLVLEKVTELGVLTDRRLQRQRLARRLEDEPHLLGRYAGALRELFRSGLASQLVDHRTVDARDAVQRLDHVDRNADRTRMVGDRARDRLADPPRRVRGELEATAVLESVHGLHEADVALLDQVEQAQVASQVPLRHRDDEAKIGLHQLLLGLADLTVAAGDLYQQRLELTTRQPDLALELADLASDGVVLSASHLQAQALDAITLAADPSHQVVDQRRLEGHVGHDLLDRLPVGCD